MLVGYSGFSLLQLTIYIDKADTINYQIFVILACPQKQKQKCNIIIMEVYNSYWDLQTQFCLEWSAEKSWLLRHSSMGSVFWSVKSCPLGVICCCCTTQNQHMEQLRNMSKVTPSYWIISVWTRNPPTETFESEIYCIPTFEKGICWIKVSCMHEDHYSILFKYINIYCTLHTGYLECRDDLVFSYFPPEQYRQQE